MFALGLGLWNIGEQLDKSYRQLLHGTARSQPFLKPAHRVIRLERAWVLLSSFQYGVAPRLPGRVIGKVSNCEQAFTWKVSTLAHWDSRLEARITGHPFGSPMEILTDVGICIFPDSQTSSSEWRAVQGFCRFPGLDSTEAERRQASHAPYSRWAISCGVSCWELHNVTSEKEKPDETEHEERNQGQSA